MSSEAPKAVIEPQIDAALKEIAALVSTFPPEARAAAAQAMIDALAENAKNQLGGMFDVSHRRWFEITGRSS